MAFDRPTDPERCKAKGFVPLDQALHARHHGLGVCRSPRHFGAATPLTVASGLRCGPAGRTRGLLVGANERAIDIVPGPVDRALGIGVLRHGRKETWPETRLAPAIATAGPGLHAPGLHAPERSGTARPGARGAASTDAGEAASMSQSGATRWRFLRWKQRLGTAPWRVGAFLAFHTGECTPPARVCKHALACPCRLLPWRGGVGRV